MLTNVFRIVFNFYIEPQVWLEIQFSMEKPQLGMLIGNFSQNVNRLINGLGGTFGAKVVTPHTSLHLPSQITEEIKRNETDPETNETTTVTTEVTSPTADYMKLEMPPAGEVVFFST